MRDGHAAEGELYRSVLRDASADLSLPVLRVPAPDLVQRAASALALPRESVPAEHKAATLAAVLALA